MKVSEVMQDKVYSVSPEDLVDRVFFLIHYEKIRHLPVLDGDKVVGMVSDRDLYKALGPRSRPRSVVQPAGDTVLYVIPRKVRHIMKRGVVTIGPDAAVTEAAGLMGQKRIGALPVVADGRLVGIVTATDLLLLFARRGGEAAC